MRGLRTGQTKTGGARTVSNSRSQFLTTVDGAMMRHVGHVAFAGGNVLRFFQSLPSCSADTCLRRRFRSVLTPSFFMIAERNEMTWMVLPDVESAQDGPKTPLSPYAIRITADGQCPQRSSQVHIPGLNDDQRGSMSSREVAAPMSSPRRAPRPSL